MTDRDTTTRTRARAPGVGGVFHRMAVHDRVLRPDSERTTVATTKCTKGGCKLDGGRRMPGAGLSRRSPRKAPLGQSAFQPYWGKLAVRNDRGDRGNVGIIRSPIRASIPPDTGSALPKFPQSVPRGLRHFVASLVRFRYGLPGCSPPCTDPTGIAQPSGTFTSRLSTDQSPSPLLDITTTVAGSPSVGGTCTRWNGS